MEDNTHVNLISHIGDVVSPLVAMPLAVVETGLKASPIMKMDIQQNPSPALQVIIPGVPTDNPTIYRQ